MKPGAKRKYDELVASDESELESDEEEKNRKEEEEKRKRQILAAQEQKKALLRQSSSAATKAPAPSTTESDKKQIKFALNKPSWELTYQTINFSRFANILQDKFSLSFGRFCRSINPSIKFKHLEPLIDLAVFTIVCSYSNIYSMQHIKVHRSYIITR